MLLSFKGEPLVLHSILTTIFFDKIYGEEYSSLFARRLTAHEDISDQISKDIIYKLFILSAMFHDIGKAFKCYQQMEKSDISFTYHELLSACAVLRLFRKTFQSGGNYVPDEILYIFAAAVLMHHQAMRDLAEYHERINKGDLLRKLGSVLEIPDNADNDFMILVNALKRYRISISVRDVKSSLDISIDNVRAVLDYLKDFLLCRKNINDTKIRHPYIWVAMVSVPIQLCDNLAASLIRPDASPLSSRMAYQALRYMDAKLKLKRKIVK